MSYVKLIAELMNDARRNEMIVTDVLKAVAAGRSPVVLTERREHLEMLRKLLEGKASHLLVLHGQMGAKQVRALDAERAAIPDSEPRVLLATGSYIGEGFDDARLVVFWSKNPRPMLECLPNRKESPIDVIDASGRNYYFQFTLNDYDTEKIEPRVPPIEERIETFKRLARRLGRDRAVWRFDPLILSDSLTVAKLLEKVERLGDRLAESTSRLVFSFIDIAAYKKVAANLERGEIKAREFLPGEMEEIARRIGGLAKGWGIKAATCGEIEDLERFGIEHNRCIDDRLIEKCFSHDAELMKFVGARLVPGDPLFGVPDRWEPSDYRKDKGQRAVCGCIMSKDIGEYNTCPHLCHYCYANANNAAALDNWKQHLTCPHAETIVGG